MPLEPAPGVGAPRGQRLAAVGGPRPAGRPEPARDSAPAEGVGHLGVGQDEASVLGPVGELRLLAVLDVEEAAVLSVVDHVDGVGHDGGPLSGGMGGPTPPAVGVFPRPTPEARPSELVAVDVRLARLEADLAVEGVGRLAAGAAGEVDGDAAELAGP